MPDFRFKIRRKYELPVCQRIPKIQFDIQRLIQSASRLESCFTDVISANKSWCRNNKEHAGAVLESFEQVPLTDYKGPDSSHSRDCFSPEDEAGLSKVGRYRIKTAGGNLDPALDERNYRHPLPLYVGSYFEECVNTFQSQALRVRLTRLKAGAVIAPHIDYDPGYAVRIVIPIVTDPKVINLFWVRGKVMKYHLPADGGAWFLNVGFKHGVQNKSKTDRLCLMFSLDGQKDIEGIGIKRS